MLANFSISIVQTRANKTCRLKLQHVGTSISNKNKKMFLLLLTFAFLEANCEIISGNGTNNGKYCGAIDLTFCSTNKQQ